MQVVKTNDGSKHDVKITALVNDDYKYISKGGHFFDWKKEKTKQVFKLTIVGASEIIGLVSIEHIPEEWRIHIRLLTVSKENKGVAKEYRNIAGNLLTFVSKLALMQYGELACVSLIPKGAIAQHYIDKYKMNITGATLSLEILEILNLIKIYDNY